MNETCTVVMSEIADGAAFFSSLDLASSSFTVNAQSQELVTKMSHHLLAEKNIAVCMAKEGNFNFGVNVDTEREWTALSHLKLPQSTRVQLCFIVVCLHFIRTASLSRSHIYAFYLQV